MKTKNYYLMGLVAMLAMVAVVSATELPLINGDIETGTTAGWWPDRFIPSVTQVHSGFFSAKLDNTVVGSPGGTGPLEIGALEKNAAGPNVWTPTDFFPGDVVTLSYWMYVPSSDPIGVGQQVISDVIAGNFEIGSAYGPETPTDVWLQKTQTLSYTTAVSSTIRIRVIFDDLNSVKLGTGTVFIDDVQLFRTPEPATMTLLGLGMSGVLLRKKRRSVR